MKNPSLVNILKKLDHNSSYPTLLYNLYISWIILSSNILNIPFIIIQNGIFLFINATIMIIKNIY